MGPKSNQNKRKTRVLSASTAFFKRFSTVNQKAEYSDTLLLAVLKANNPDKFRDRVEQINLMDIDPDKLSSEMLDKIAEHLIAKALAGKSPAMVEEARRRLEAGEKVTVEGLCRDMGETEEPKP
jgi:hypothetical protein